MDPRVQTICDLVAEGETVRQIATTLGISSGMVLKIINEGGEEAGKQYARARDIAADLLEADILTRASAVTPDSAPADRVAIDALKWVAARRSPKRYSERIIQEHSGAVAITKTDLTDDQLAAIAAGSRPGTASEA